MNTEQSSGGSGGLRRPRSSSPVERKARARSAAQPWMRRSIRCSPFGRGRRSATRSSTRRRTPSKPPGCRSRRSSGILPLTSHLLKLGPRPDRDTAQAMSQENVEVVRRLWLAKANGTTKCLISVLADDFEPVSDPRANMEMGLPQRTGGSRSLHRRLHFFLRRLMARGARKELIDAGDWVVVVVRSGGRGRTSGVPVSHVWTLAYKVHRGRITRIVFHPDKREAMASLKAAGLSEQGEGAGLHPGGRTAWPPVSFVLV